MFVVLVVLDLALTGAALLNLDLIDRLRGGEDVPSSDLDADDTRLGSISLGNIGDRQPRDARRAGRARDLRRALAHEEARAEEIAAKPRAELPGAAPATTA